MGSARFDYASDMTLQQSGSCPRRRVLACGLLCACLALPGVAADVPDDPAAWLESDAELQAPAVNEGELEFLAELPERRVLHTSNWLTIDPASLSTGWVALRQCQSNLDPVDRVEIVYRYQAMRNLRVLSSRGVGSARIVDGAVQMTQVRADAAVCIAAEVQVLRQEQEGRFVLQSGPFHRRFLDGYYPVRLDYRVEYPSSLLVIESIQPVAQSGFDVGANPGRVQIDALFEGRLTIRLVLRRAALLDPLLE
jgi:hypothetical protein